MENSSDSSKPEPIKSSPLISTYFPTTISFFKKLIISAGIIALLTIAKQAGI